MSWFDTSGLTSLAKSALKEAQKTIDKALDIQQDGTEAPEVPAKEKCPTEPTPTPVRDGPDFFSSWGLTSSDSLTTSNASDIQAVITESPSKTSSQSLWGSFTGSFFETPGGEKHDNEKARKPTLEMIVDDSSELGGGDEPFSTSQLVVHGMSEDSEGSSSYSRLNSENEREPYLDNIKLAYDSISASNPEISSDQKQDVALHLTKTVEYPVVLRRSSDRNSSYLNRLSIISSESGKNSSESIEVLGSQSLKTTPDSEGVSLNHSVSASSSMGLRLASSSVEVLPDSLMTPSSIELLRFTNSGDISHASDEEFRSPLTSPIDNDNYFHSKVGSKASTDEDIKILTDATSGVNDDDEASAADDTISYNSISEFTAPTILDSSNNIKSVDLLNTRKSGSQFNNEIIEDYGSDVSGSPQHNSDETPITRAPSRSTSQFSTHSGSVKSLIFNVDKSLGNTIMDTLDNVLAIHPPQYSNPNESYVSSNDGSWSDRTLTAESEGAGMESSSDDVQAQTAAMSEKGSASLYVSGMLEDAINDKLSDKTTDSSTFCKMDESMMHPTWTDGTYSSCSQSYEEVDKASNIDQMENITMSHVEFTSREQSSPVSSESRSGDMVKVGSEQTSGHTSGDDLETTTSSDIEIIPSPNGDYGSIYGISRQSPVKLPIKFPRPPCSGNVVDIVLGKTLASKVRGHNRELSEASSQSNTSDDSHCSEAERLMRRLAEMAEVLESREAKLIEVSRTNVELHDSNAELKMMIESLQGKQDPSEVTMLTEDYTHRLSVLEKKFQQAIREKDILRKQVETYKTEAAVRMTSGQLESIIGERDETIKELREEGEKLSKQQLHHSTIIKRLRTKEKENEQVIKTLRDKVAEQAQELDRMKRSLSAKEAIECSQIETVYKLTSSNKKLDAELADTKGLLDDTNQRLETTKTSLDAARKELMELQKNSGDLARRQEALSLVEKEKSTMETENEQLMHQLEELRIKMRQDEQRWMSREAALRSEVSRQLARAEEAEAYQQPGDCAGTSGSEGGALLAQLTALQESSLERDRRAQARERHLQQATADAQSKLTQTLDKYQLLKEECQILRTKLTTVENNLLHTTQKLDNSSAACLEHMSQLSITLESNERLKYEFESHKCETIQTINDINERLRSAEQRLSIEKAACEAEKRRNGILQEQLREMALPSEHNMAGPSLLLARLVGQQIVEPPGVQPADRLDAHSPHGSIGRDSLASESLGSGVWPTEDNESCVMSNMGTGGSLAGEGLCAMERLQAALQRREGELRAARKAGRRSHAQRTALQNQLAVHAAELDTMQSLQHQYDALLQMYGEKEEQLQELRLDLQDVKDMYKMQLDEILMLKRQAAERNNQKPS